VLLSSGWVGGLVLAEEGGGGEEGGNKVREWLRSSGGGRMSRPASGMRPGSSKSRCIPVVLHLMSGANCNGL
jgi:hypothetical protein